MKIDLLGSTVKMSELPDNVEISNGTIILTQAECAIDARMHHNLKLTDNTFILARNYTKWDYIKLYLRLAWKELRK